MAKEDGVEETAEGDGQAQPKRASRWPWRRFPSWEVSIAAAWPGPNLEVLDRSPDCVSESGSRAASPALHSGAPPRSLTVRGGGG